MKRSQRRKQVRGDDRYRALVRRLFVDESRDRERSWVDVNSLLAEALSETNDSSILPSRCSIQNQPLVAGKKVDLKTDPPPDLVVEVDITSTNLDKFTIYSMMGLGILVL